MNPTQLLQAEANATHTPAACGTDCVPAIAAALPGVHSRLLEQLAHTASPGACQRIAGALLERANPEVIDALIAHACNSQGCRHEHLVLALREHVDVVVDGLARCLANRQAGVRLAGVRLVGSVGTAPATRLLATLIETESDVEVCQAAVVALGEAGDHRAVPALRRLARRFPGHGTLAFDIDVAIGQIE